MGDDVIFTGDGSDETYLFKNGTMAKNCDFEDATKVDGGVYESWPDDDNFRRAAKEKKFFGNNSTDSNSTDCDTLAVIFSPKIFRPKRRGCDGDNDILEAKNFTRGNYFKCAQLCRKKRDCQGVQAYKEDRQSELQCELYSNKPSITDSPVDGTRCFQLFER